MDFENNTHLEKHSVRLFPTAHITSEKEAEMRATASLLAMVMAVSKFGRSIIHDAGGPKLKKGKLSCYTEVGSEDPASKKKETIRPDGIIRIVWGKTDWKALVEAKVGKNDLEKDQIEEYCKLLKSEGFKALITISNQAAQSDGSPPLDLSKSQRKRIFHFSWERLLSIAQVLSSKKDKNEKEEIEDKEQRWMLKEWIRYVDDPNSKIVVQPDLGEHWSYITKSAGSWDRSADKLKMEDVIRNWFGFLNKSAFRLNAMLGEDVKVIIPSSERKEPDKRVKKTLNEVFNTGCISGNFRIPETVGDISLKLDLRRKCARYDVTFSPPTSGSQKRRVSWLTKQIRKLNDPPSDIEVIIEWSKKGVRSQVKIHDLLKDGTCFMWDTNKNKIDKNVFPRKFRIEWVRKLQSSRDRSKVLKGVFEDLKDFYQKVIQKLERYSPSAPKISENDVKSSAVASE